MTVRSEDGTLGASGVEWTPAHAERVALDAGVAPLGPLHWKVIALYREEVARTGLEPDLERLASLGRLSTADLGALFPGDTGRVLARIAGPPLLFGRAGLPLGS